MKFKNWSLQKNYSKDTLQLTLKDFLRQIDLNSYKLKKIEASLQGVFKSTQAGTGLDFNEIREYRIGDDLRHISWASTAKTGTLQTKEYFAEKEIRSYFLIDISNSMFCGNKLEPFIQLFAFLLNLSCSFSEKIGGVFFTGEIKYHFPLRESLSQANIMFQTFLDFLNNKNINAKTNLSSITDLSQALEFTNKYFSKKGMIFIISDFINLTNWEKMIYLTSQKQNIYSFQIYDLIDYLLPEAGYITIIDPETNERCIVNTDSKVIQGNYETLMTNKQEKLNSFLKSIGATHLIIKKNDFN